MNPNKLKILFVSIKCTSKKLKKIKKGAQSNDAQKCLFTKKPVLEAPKRYAVIVCILTFNRLFDINETIAKKSKLPNKLIGNKY